MLKRINNLDQHVRGYVFAGITSFLISLNFVLSKLILRDVNPETSTVYFFGFGALSSFFLLVFTKKLNKLKLFKRYYKPVLALGLLGGVGATLWFYAIDMIGPSLTAFLARFIIVFTVLWGVLFFKERFNIGEVAGMAVAVVGALIMTYTSGNFLLLGVVVILAATFFFSISQLIVKAYAQRIDPFVVNHLRLLLIFLAVLIYSFSTAKLQTPTSAVFVLAFLGGTLGGAIGIGFFYKALELADLSKVNIIRTMDPFVVMLYAFLILRDVPTAQQLIGGLFVVGGVITLILARHKPKFLLKWLPIPW